MPRREPRRLSLKFRPLEPKTWADFDQLFGPRGACAGCWCMWWRLKRSVWTAGKGAGNKRAMKKLVSSGIAPGIIATIGEEPVGWCSIGPREDFVGLARSRVLKPVDEYPVWSIVCFFVAREHRRKGITSALIAAAVDFARKNGAKIIEGYPVVAKGGTMPDVWAYTGLPSAFQRAGFMEVARRSPTRPIMRYIVRSSR